MNMVLNRMIQLSAAAEALPKGSIISFDIELLKNLAMIWVNVIILIAVLAFILYKPVRKFMDDRGQAIKNKLDHAKTTLDEADELKEQYEGKLRDIDKEREEILAQAYKKAMERSEHILKEAREEAENIYAHTMAELEEEKVSVQDELRRELIELSVLVAGKFIEKSLDEETHDKFIEDALQDWEEGLWLN